MSEVPNLNLPTNDPANIEDFVFEGKRGRPRRKACKYEVAPIVIRLQQGLLKIIDDFCFDQGVSRTSFFRMAIYRYAKEMGIKDYVLKYDQGQPSDSSVEEEPTQSPEQRNAYGSPWTTDS